MDRNERAIARRTGKLIFAALVTLLCFIEELVRQRWVPAILCGVAAGILFFVWFRIARQGDDSDSEHTKRHESDDRLFIIGGLVCIFILILVAFISHK